VVELVVEAVKGRVAVGATSNLSVLVHPASRVASALLSAEQGPIDYASNRKSGDDLPRRSTG